jgi:hypothetical protein
VHIGILLKSRSVWCRVKHALKECARAALPPRGQRRAGLSASAQGRLGHARLNACRLALTNSFQLLSTLEDFPKSPGFSWLEYVTMWVRGKLLAAMSVSVARKEGLLWPSTCTLGFTLRSLTVALCRWKGWVLPPPVLSESPSVDQLGVSLGWSPALRTSSATMAVIWGKLSLAITAGLPIPLNNFSHKVAPVPL